MNKEIAPSIRQKIDEIIYQIENKVYFDDKVIENILKGQLEQLDDENRTEIIQCLHEQLPGQTFLNLPYFAQIQNNLRQIYYENLKQKQFDQILSQLTNEQYCKQNMIPVSIKNYLIPLQKLGNDLHLIFDLIEVVKQEGQPNFISLLKLLINLFFLECDDNQIKGLIHQFVGSLLVNQIYQFEHYIAQVIQKEEIRNCFKDIIYKVQSKEILAKQGKEILFQSCQDKQTLFLYELFTHKVGSQADNLIGFIKNLICVKNNKINKDDLTQYVSLTENFDENLDILCFRLMFYFWISLFKLKESILDFEDRLSKSKLKKQVLENGIKNLNSIEKNMIYRYLIQKILYYSNFEDEDFKEGQRQWDGQQQEFIQKIGVFIPSNKEKLKLFAENSKKLMFYQLKSLQIQQQDFTNEIYLLSFIATNELNGDLDNFLIKIVETNFKQLNEKELDNFPKEQKINLLHLVQSLKSKSQVKMSRFFNQSETFIQYPKQLEIKVEEFNMSLTSKNNSQNIVDEWLKDKTNQENFRKLLPYYFNIIKRGESPEDLLRLMNKNEMQQKQSQRNETLNLKSLFQLLYNNSDKELQMILLKIHSKNYPVPLLYQNPQLERDKTQIKDFYIFNTNIFYLLSDDFPIINFSLSQSINQIGKSELINKVFYVDEKDKNFEISDSSTINNNSVDCQFDFSFNGSRNYLIADVHGQLEDEIFQKILPFFQLWIIQMKTDDEFDENVDKLKELCEKMKINFKPKIILIIRDSEKKELNKEKIEELKLREFNFHTYQIPNMQQIKNEAIKKDEWVNIKKFILQQIGTRNDRIQDVEIQESFLQICNSFNVNDQEIRKSQQILNKLTDELNKIIQKEDGFYSIEAFPLRNLTWEIKSKKEQSKQINYTKLQLEQNLEKKKNAIVHNKNMENRNLNILEQKENEKLEIENKIEQNNVKLLQFDNEIAILEEKQRQQNFNESQLIKNFSLIFQQNDYYITYLRIVEHIAKFNQKNLKNLYIQIGDLRQQLDSLKIEQEKQRRELEVKLKSQKINVYIELFWREVIKGDKSFQQSPVTIVCQLIKKGEPFEFLNGDDLTIDSNFLIQLREELLDKDDKKILFLSILGPQSSGKSTLLNRMFGCHFLSSMGRCTKGLFLQLLKISNKEQFYNFDYILLLDSEGLQSPNQQDPEFDKKISLFLIQISDILIFIVKGEIHSTFHNLIEVSFYTLAQYSKLKFLKQFAWCFNQNSQINDDEKIKLLNQIDDIGKKLQSEKNLTEEDGRQFQYAKHLDLTKNNIYNLGMASKSQEWENSDDSRQKQFQEITCQDYSKNALSFGMDLIQNFISKYKNQQNNHYQILTWNAFITKVQQCWEIVTKLPDLVEFSNLKEQKDYETINKIATEKMMKANEQYQDFDTIIYQIQAKSKHINSLENYHQIQKEFQQDFLQQCNNQKEEILKELQHEYSYQIISDAIRKKVQGNIAEVYYAIGLEGTLIILQQIHQLISQFQYSHITAKMQYTLDEILNNSQQLKTLQEDNSIRDKKFEQIWNELFASQNLEGEKLYIEFQKKLFDCFLIYKKEYQFKIEKLEDKIDYFVKYINNQDPNLQKESQMDRICSLFLEDFQQNSFNKINRQSSQQFQRIDILQRLDNLDQSSLINPQKYLQKKTTFTVLKKTKIVQILKQNLKLKLIQIGNEEKGEKKKQLEIEELFMVVKQLPIEFDQNIYKVVLDLIKKDFSRFLQILDKSHKKTIQQNIKNELPIVDQQQESFYRFNNDSFSFRQKTQGIAEEQIQFIFQPQKSSYDQLTQNNQNAKVRIQQTVNPGSSPFVQSNNYQKPLLRGQFQSITNQLQPPNQQNKKDQQIKQTQQLEQLFYKKNQNQRYLQDAQTFTNPYVNTSNNLQDNQTLQNSFIQSNSTETQHKQTEQKSCSTFDDHNIDNLINSLQVSQDVPKYINIFSFNYLQQQFPEIKEKVYTKEQMNDEDQKQYFILKEDVQIRFNQIQNHQYEPFFANIISQITNQNDQNDQNDFQHEFPQIFIQIMTENQGWKKLCQNIYDIIQKQFDETKKQQESSNVFYIISQYNRQQLQAIMKKVEKQLEQMNQELAFYGIEFSSLFIRKLQFYSCFIIWRFMCYDKLQMSNKEQQQFQQNKAILKNKYENAILNNLKKESQDQGKQYAEILYNLCTMQFYKEKKINAIQLINQNQKTSSQLIKELDQKLLIIREESKIKDQSIASIFEYVSDQRIFIVKYVESFIKNLRNEIQMLIEIKPYIQECLNLIKNNAIILFNRRKILQNTKSENHTLSQKQILKYILGQNVGKIEHNLDKQIFLDDEGIKKKQLNLPIEQILQRDGISVKFFETFLEEFLTQISKLFDGSNTLITQFNEFQLQGQLEEMKNIMNGCDQSCPICNRKCDSEFYQEKDHKHKCSNGHQLRGMNKILIRNSPSLFTCEEIVDEAEIQIKETCKIKTWKEIKAYYKNWSFMDILKKEEQQLNKLKMIKIWNSGIGQYICLQLSKEFKYEIPYQQKYDLPMNQQHSSTHYIFILDDSASMRNNWESVINCVKSQFQQINRKKYARVSVVIFNKKARIVLKCEKLRNKEQLKQITFSNGQSTNYGPAFQLTFELLKENTEYNNSVILFYTDGLGNYPTTEIEQFGKISKRMRDTIYFLACSQPNKNLSLDQILTFCKGVFFYSEWRDKIEPIQLNKNWQEMISQAHLDKFKA